MGVATIIGYVNFIAIAFAVLFGVLSISTNNWRTSSLTDFNYGLWKVCHPLTCFKHTQDETLPTRVLMIITCLCFAVVVVLRLLGCFIKSLSPKILTLFLILAFVFELSAVATYTDKMKQDGFSFSWSYHLGWVSAFLALITGIINLFERRDE